MVEYEDGYTETDVTSIALPLFKHALSLGVTLTNLAAGSLSLGSGRVTTVLPPLSRREMELHIRGGDVNQGVMWNWLNDRLESFLWADSMHAAVWPEDHIKPSWPVFSRFQSLDVRLFHEEIYHIVYGKEDLANELSLTLPEICSRTKLGLLVSLPPTWPHVPRTPLTIAQIEFMASHVHGLFLHAFDEEGYLIWQCES